MNLSTIVWKNIRGGCSILTIYIIWVVLIILILTSESIEEILKLVLVVLVTLFFSPIIACWIFYRLEKKTIITPICSKIISLSSTRPLATNFDFSADIFRPKR